MFIKWKKYVLDNLSELFNLVDNSSNKKNFGKFGNLSEDEANKLYAQIGKLKVEKDFLEKKLEG